jgi:ubiquitin-protein ligase
MTLRARRLENEWKLLAQLAEHNPGILEVVRRETLPDADVFHVVLHRTSVLSLIEPRTLMQFASHEVAFRFPSYYPSVPIEAFLVKPVFHPNVHPENGFVCLWDKFSSGDTIVEAIVKLQKVITWELWNGRDNHVMQPEALGLEKDPARPLESQALQANENTGLQELSSLRKDPGHRRLTN